MSLIIQWSWIRVMLGLTVLGLFSLSHHARAATGDGNSTTKIHAERIKYFVSGYRINVSAEASDAEGILIVRCYFRAAGESDFLFIKMSETAAASDKLPGGKHYIGTMPAAGKDTDSIDYLFLVVNAKQQAVKTQTFTSQRRDETEPPAWQQMPDSSEIKVFTELDAPPKQLTGFGDNVALDIVESSARFGILAGLYSSSQESASGAAAIAVSEGTVGAKAGSTAASSTAISGKTMGLVAAGVAVIAGGAIAAGGGGGGGGGSSSTADCTQFDGNWGGTWSGVDCDGFSEIGPWSMTCTNCGCSASTPEENLSGTIVGNNGTLTGVGDCGNTTATATFSSSQVSGDYRYSLGGSGTFSGTRQ